VVGALRNFDSLSHQKAAFLTAVAQFVRISRGEFHKDFGSSARVFGIFEMTWADDEAE